MMAFVLTLLFAGPPDSIRGLVESRKAVVGQLCWEVETPAGRTLSFISRIAQNGDYIFEQRGDQQGWTITNADGTGVSKFPQNYLHNSEGFWGAQETGTDINHWRAGGEQERAISTSVKEVRSIGLLPWSGNIAGETGIDAPLNAGKANEVAGWESVREGALEKVTARYQSGREVTWYLNPEKGGNPERVVHTYRGNVVDYCELKLREFDGVWFPEEVHHFKDGKPLETIRIRRADLSAKQAPPALSLANLGLESGVSIVAQNYKSDSQLLVWNGASVVTGEKWLAEIRSGASTYGPRLEAARVSGYYDSPYMTDEQRIKNRAFAKKLALEATRNNPKRLWEEYVKWFIKHYLLDAEQSQKAWVIFHDCSGRANEYVERKEKEFDELNKRLETAQAKMDKSLIEAATKDIDALSEPLERIFEQELKPRLDRLPTRAQRKAAEASTSQPAKTAPENQNVTHPETAGASSGGTPR